ncbi:XdhC/CoxI family protein [Thermovirga lienii]|uniref:XdhC family protein n=1 Tax=Thermovirga lienii TaxID=336261 RepID=UPI000EE9C29A|nr:xanthine dehydrogenase [Thermovirga lienii]
MDLELLRLINEETREGRFGVLCTVVRSHGSTPRKLGASMWVRSDGSIAGTIGGGALEKAVIQRALEVMEDPTAPKLYESILREKESQGQAVCGGEVSVLLEPLGMEPKIIIFGAGHVGAALARLASAARFNVIVWDEREEYANQDRFPGCKAVACSLEEAVCGGVIPIARNSYVVVVTRGHSLDEEVVRSLEGKPMAYLGVIGSRRKISFMRKSLMEKGVSEEFLDSIFQPIGLPIRAETPEEIALSILAEIVGKMRGADLEALRGPYKTEGKDQL